MTLHQNRPHDNCYWVEPGKLLAGEYPGDRDEKKAKQKLRSLLNHGVTFFLDLTEATDPLDPYEELLELEARSMNVDIAYRSEPLPDMGVPHTRRHMADILDVIDQAMADGHCAYVHCWGGIGRTGTVIGCYLVRRGRSGEEALSELAAHWSTVAKRDRQPETPQTEDQIHWVRGWDEGPG